MSLVRLLPVVGMHRSRTSAVAGALGIIGAPLGPDEALMEGREDNPQGFFEHIELVNVDRAVLGALGGSWRRLPVFVEGWHRDERLQRARDHATGWLRSLEDGQLLVKDPRMSLLLPFWRDLADVGPVLHVVRDPSQVARSLRARDGLSPEASAQLWLQHVVAVAVDAPDASVVFADDVVTDPVAALAPYAERIGLEPPATVRDELQAFVSAPDEKAGDPLDGPAGRAAQRVYEQLLAGDELDVDLLTALVRHEPEVSSLPPGGPALSDAVLDLRGALGEARRRAEIAEAANARAERDAADANALRQKADAERDAAVSIAEELHAGLAELRRRTGEQAEALAAAGPVGREHLTAARKEIKQLQRELQRLQDVEEAFARFRARRPVRVAARAADAMRRVTGSG